TERSLAHRPSRRPRVPCLSSRRLRCAFLFNAAAPAEIYTLSLHDALPISRPRRSSRTVSRRTWRRAWRPGSHRHWSPGRGSATRSEEHTSELQSRENLVCRLLLEKKKPAVRVCCRRFLTVMSRTARQGAPM